MFKRPKFDSTSKDYGSQELWYSEIYQSLSCGSESGIMSRIAHNAIEKSVFEDASKCFSKILEVGGGDGIHLSFVNSDFDQYFLTDYDDSQLNKAAQRLSSDHRSIFCKNENAESLSFGDNTFDRLIATCVLLHLEQPEIAVREWRRVVKGGGEISIFYPHEPEVLTRLARKLLLGRKAAKLGFGGFDLLMAREHRNSAWRVETFLKFVFKNDLIKIKRWPLKRGPFALNSFTVFHVQKSLD